MFEGLATYGTRKFDDIMVNKNKKKQGLYNWIICCNYVWIFSYKCNYGISEL